ncbi:cupin domain-containing protein [Actinomycetes bacterium KLBMP 9759]
MDGDDDELHLPARQGRAFRLREVTLPPGDWQPVVEDEWLGAMIVVQCGEVELHCLRGGQRNFRAGAVLWFEGLGLRAMHNPGECDTVLVAFARRANGAHKDLPPLR